MVAMFGKGRVEFDSVGSIDAADVAKSKFVDTFVVVEGSVVVDVGIDVVVSNAGNPTNTARGTTSIINSMNRCESSML